MAAIGVPQRDFRSPACGTRRADGPGPAETRTCSRDWGSGETEGHWWEGFSPVVSHPRQVLQTRYSLRIAHAPS